MTRQATVPAALALDAAAAGQATAVCVYVALDALYGGCVAGIWPGQNLLAVQLRVSRATVQRALRWLRAEGWVTVTARTGARGERTTNLYELHPDAAADPHRFDEATTRARFKERAARELYARAQDEPGDPVENPGGAVPVRSGPARSDPRVTGDATPASPVTHNPYLPSRSNWAAASRVVHNPDPDPHDLEGLDLVRHHITASFAALGLERRPLRPL